MLPHFYEAKELGRRCGYGVASSGAGPAILFIGRKGNGMKEELLSGLGRIFVERHRVIESRASNNGVTEIG